MAYSEVMMIRFEKALTERLTCQAKRLCATKSAIVRMALVRFLEEQEKYERENGK